MVWLIYTLIAKLVGHISVEGYTTIIIIMLLGFGLTMLFLGILGSYIWRMFDAVRNRPPYIIDDIDLDEYKSRNHL